MTMERVLDAAFPARWLRGEIAVVGLARSGRSAAQLLARTGANVYASDVSATPAVDATARALRDEGVGTDVGRHDLDRVARASLVVASPGVPPDAPPFVKVGDRVTPGQVLCIIESMKLMNEIESEVSGTIVAKLVENGRPVEYGESLFAVQPS